MGTLRVAGTTVGGTRKAWTKLAATAEKNSSQLVIRGDVAWWPTGSLVGIGATEYPDPVAGGAEALVMLEGRGWKSLVILEDPL